jgi:hypothetical protein
MCFMAPHRVRVLDVHGHGEGEAVLWTPLWGGCKVVNLDNGEQRCVHHSRAIAINPAEDTGSRYIPPQGVA